MERLEDFCESCGELESKCSCYFLFEEEQNDVKPFKFEYAFESLTEKSTFFYKNMPEK